jgi:hypothetical protein
MTNSHQGFQIAELVVSLAVLSLLLMLGVPALLHFSSGLRLRLAAAELEAALRSTRSMAIRLDTEVAVKFRPRADGTYTWAVYRDGNGNGVLNRDITSGADPLVTQPRVLEELGNRMRFGFPPGRAPRDPSDPGKRLTASDPIRFNQSDLASFGPLGTSTPGSLYVTDGQSKLMAVRVFGRTGKVKIIAYDFDAEIWK